MENNENKKIPYDVNSYKPKSKNQTYTNPKSESVPKEQSSSKNLTSSSNKEHPFTGAGGRVNSPGANKSKTAGVKGKPNAKTKNAAKKGAKPNKRKEKSKSKFTAAIVAVAIVCALIGGAVGAGIVYFVTPDNNSSNTVKNISIDSSYKSNVEAVADKDLPSVVGIEVSVKSNSILKFPNSQDNSDSSSDSQALSQGSGIVYKDNGYIVTNYHVISNAISNSNASIKVYLNSDASKSYDAQVVGYDAGADLAVLKINANGLSVIEVGDSDNLKVGETAIAIGNPGGMDFAGSVSQGIISGLNRTITLESGIEMKLIQTDAAINPGNSGGALVDGTGKLIGISSAKLASSDYEGMGFAIPVSNVVSIADKLISNEGKTTPYLGITMDTRYTSSVLQANGYPSGVVVASVADNSPASAAGLKQADIITKINDTATPSADVLKSAIANANVGDKVKLEVYRNGQTSTVTVTLGVASGQ